MYHLQVTSGPSDFSGLCVCLFKHGILGVTAHEIPIIPDPQFSFQAISLQRRDAFAYKVLVRRARRGGDTGYTDPQPAGLAGYPTSSAKYVGVIGRQGNGEGGGSHDGRWSRTRDAAE